MLCSPSTFCSKPGIFCTLCTKPCTSTTPCTLILMLIGFFPHQIPKKCESLHLLLCKVGLVIIKVTKPLFLPIPKYLASPKSMTKLKPSEPATLNKMNLEDQTLAERTVKYTVNNIYFSLF